MKAKNLINQLTKLGFYMVDGEFFNEDELEGYGTCTLQNDNSLNIDYINITYDDYEILGNVEISINGKNKLVKPSKLIDVLKLYESKKSSHKSLKESFSKSDIIDLLKDLERQPEDTLPMVKLYTNLINFMLMAYKNKSNDEIRKEYGRMTCGEWKNVLNNLLNESKKFARKALKESTKILAKNKKGKIVGYIEPQRDGSFGYAFGSPSQREVIMFYADTLEQAKNRIAEHSYDDVIFESKKSARKSLKESVKTEQFEDFPQYAVTYFAYNDSDGLTKDDIKDAEKWAKKNGVLSLSSVDSDSYFSNHPQFGLPTDCVDVTCIVE